MAAERDRPEQPPNVMEKLLRAVREQYVEEHGEEPPDEFVEELRERILRDAAKRSRDEHRDVYDALAEE